MNGSLAMHANLSASLDRADELLKELLAEYDRSLRSKEVSTRAVQLTHEVCERLRSVLDRLVRRYWDLRVAPALSADDKKAATVYFPIASDQNGFDSILGRWRWKGVRAQHQPVYDYLLARQPFANANNAWLTVLNDLAVQGKHIDLVPQVRQESKRITVAQTQGGGTVSWDPSSVKFGSGVFIHGVPVDPATQRVVPHPSVEERIETWVSFNIQGHGVNAAGFCQEACHSTRSITNDMSNKFGLS